MIDTMRSLRQPIGNLARMVVIALASLGCASSPLLAQDVDSAQAQSIDAHAQHRQLMANSEAKRSLMNYHVPSLAMVRQDGVQVLLDHEIDDGRAVVLSFIFTSCPTICPATSQVLSTLQRKLDERRADVHLVSISIDPEQDTPARLREYAARFDAGPHWQHYTGTLGASIEVQRAFDVYRGDKSNHLPVTLVRSAPGAPWVRLEGFATSAALLRELEAGQLAPR